MHRRATRRHAGLTPPARALAALIAAAVPALAACSGEAVDLGTGVINEGGTAGGGGTTGGTGGGQLAAAVIGRWSRLVTFTTGGVAHATETIWEFRADGSAQRTLVTTNLTDGIADVVIWRGTWRTVGDEIAITYTSPVQGTVRFRWRVERGLDFDVLWLGDTWFQRVW